MIHEVRVAGAKLIGQVADHRLLARAPLDLFREILGHAGFLAVAESVRLAVLLYRVAFPLGAFGKDHQRVGDGLFCLSLMSNSISFCRWTLYSGMQQRMEVTYAV